MKFNLLSVIVWMILCVATSLAGLCSPEASLTAKLNVCSYKALGRKSILDLNISPMCQVLDLSHNNLTVINDFTFFNLSRLLYLDLSHNYIKLLQPRSFAGLQQLNCLDVSYNLLYLGYEAYPKELFHPLGNLKVLNVGNNDFFEYPDVTFQVLSSLVELRMDFSSAVPFGPGFSNLKSLQKLTALNCIGKRIREGIFTAFENVPLFSLNIKECFSPQLVKSVFEPFRFLTNLDLSNNYFGLEASMASLRCLKGGNLSVINFSNVNSEYQESPENKSVTIDMFKNLHGFCLRSLDLSNNFIFQFDPRALLQIQPPECLEVLKLNHFYIPKQSAQFMWPYLVRFRNLRFLDFVGSTLRKSFQNSVSLFSNLIYNVTIPSALEVVNISGCILTCKNYKDLVFNGAKSLHTLNISNSGGVGCYHRNTSGLETVRNLDISGNAYSRDLSAVFFSSFPHLKHLVARDTPLTKAFQTEESVLQPLTILQYLDIRNAGLTSLPAKLLTNQPDMRTLDVSYNKLTAIPKLVFTLRKLNDLDLRYNIINHIPASHREALDLFVRKYGGLKLWLEGNPISCNCNTYAFIEWLWTSLVTFDKNGNYTCELDNGQFVPSASLKPTIQDRKVACVSSFWVKFAAVGSSFTLSVLLASVIVYRNRVRIKYWYHGIRGRNGHQTEGRFKYDALVAYCHQDSDWVTHHLFPELVNCEQGRNGYKLCLYEKDFLPGVPIEDCIMAAINRSYKIIMVITPSFVKSVWCKYEMQLARMKMVQEGREDVIIPIILEDVPVSSMSKSLLNLWNTSVFLIWSDSPGEQRHFWTNLISALGPPRVAESAGGAADVTLLHPAGVRGQNGHGANGGTTDDDDLFLM